MARRKVGEVMAGAAGRGAPFGRSLPPRLCPSSQGRPRQLWLYPYLPRADRRLGWRWEPPSEDGASSFHLSWVGRPDSGSFQKPPDPIEGHTARVGPPLGRGACGLLVCVESMAHGPRNQRFACLETLRNRVRSTFKQQSGLHGGIHALDPFAV
eukprot:scaffold1313_cov349-Pavlova_lutheri.AAC.2